jgi:hypothetical protein
MFLSIDAETWASMEEYRFILLWVSLRGSTDRSFGSIPCQEWQKPDRNKNMKSKEGKSYCKHPAPLLHLATGPIPRVPICGSQSLCFAQAAH